MSIFLLFAFLFAVLVCILAIQTLVRAVKPPTFVVQGAACGSCGYAVRDISAEARCPECGAFYLQAGIATGSMALRLQATTAGLVISWTLLMIMACIPILFVATFMVRLGSQGSAAIQQIKSQQGYRSAGRQRALSGENVAHFRYDLEFSSDAVTDDVGVMQSGTLSLKLVKDDQTEPVSWSMDFATKVIVLSDGNDQIILETDLFDEAASELFYQTAGYDLEAEQIQIDSAQLVNIVQMTADGFMQTGYAGAQGSVIYNDQGIFQDTGGGSSFGTAARPARAGISTSGFVYVGALLFGLIIYFVGLVFLLKKRRKLLGSVT